MMARSKSSNQRPDTLMQDRTPPDRRNPLATHGRTIHLGQTRKSARRQLTVRLRLSSGRLRRSPTTAMGHVWTAPGCQGIDHVAALVGAAMCSAYSAAHRAAGHNALRGSGPGQQLAFDDAMAHVGCPDHRIDRFCITCCQPFPTVSSRRCRRDLVQCRLPYRANATGSL